MTAGKEMGDMKKLLWCLVVAFAVVGGGMFGILKAENIELDKENKAQDVVIKQKTESAMFLRVDTRNQVEHNEFRSSVKQIEGNVGKVETNIGIMNTKIDNLSSGMNEIKEYIKNK